MMAVERSRRDTSSWPWRWTNSSPRARASSLSVDRPSGRPVEDHVELGDDVGLLQYTPEEVEIDAGRFRQREAFVGDHHEAVTDEVPDQLHGHARTEGADVLDVVAVDLEHGPEQRRDRPWSPPTKIWSMPGSGAPRVLTPASSTRTSRGNAAAAARLTVAGSTVLWITTIAPGCAPTRTPCGPVTTSNTCRVIDDRDCDDVRSRRSIGARVAPLGAGRFGAVTRSRRRSKTATRTPCSASRIATGPPIMPSPMTAALMSTAAVIASQPTRPRTRCSPSGCGDDGDGPAAARRRSCTRPPSRLGG